MPQYQNKLNLINQELGRLGQDKITDDVLARIVRNNNPDFYKDWSNEAIVDAHLWQIPELRNKERLIRQVLQQLQTLQNKYYSKAKICSGQLKLEL